MTRYRLTEAIDLDVTYDIEISRYGAAYFERHGITRAAFKTKLLSLPSIGYEADGHPIGGMIFDGNQPHMAVHPQHHGKWGVLWKPSLEWVFSFKDPIRALVEADNTLCVQFMERNGWPRIDESKEFIVFEWTAKNHPLFRKRPCQDKQ